MDQYVDAGENLKLKLPITGKGPFNYKLKRNGVDIPDSENRFKLNDLDGTLIVTLPSKDKINFLKFEISTKD